MTMYLPKVDKHQSYEHVENENIIKEKNRLRGQNYYYRSNLTELDIHKEENLDIMDRLKQLDKDNRSLNKVNNELRSGNMELSSCLRTLADERFQPKIEESENNRLKDSYLVLKNDTDRLYDKMKDKLVVVKEISGRKLKATLN